jgi:hypothetical protein
MTDESAAQGGHVGRSMGTLIFPHQKCMNRHALCACLLRPQQKSTGPSFDLPQMRATLKF